MTIRRTLLAGGIAAIVILGLAALVFVRPRSTPTPAASTAVADADSLEYVRLLRRRGWKAAVEHFRRRVEEAGERADLHALLGGALVDDGDDVDARAELQTALRLDPNCSPAHVFLGNLSAFSGDLKTAEDEFRLAAACARVPFDQAVAQAAMADIRFWSGDLTSARQGYESAMALVPGIGTLRGRFLQQLAMIAELQHRDDEVPKLLRSAIDDERHPGAAAQLVEYYLSLGRPADAAQAVGDGGDPEPGADTPGVHTWTERLVLRACVATGDVERARRLGVPFFSRESARWPVDLAFTVKVAAPDPSRTGNQPYDLLWRKDGSGALAALDHLLAATPDDERALFLSAAAHLVNDDRGAAEADARRMLEMHRNVKTLTACTNVLLYNGKTKEVADLISHRRMGQLSLVKLRALLRMSVGRERFLGVAILSERNIGPGPEHVYAWRLMYAPPASSEATHVWDTW